MKTLSSMDPIYSNIYTDDEVLLAKTLQFTPHLALGVIKHNKQLSSGGIIMLLVVHFLHTQPEPHNN
jgi:hypothetical protein